MGFPTIVTCTNDGSSLIDSLGKSGSWFAAAMTVFNTFKAGEFPDLISAFD
jgi:hypothetical protein